ncbi:Cobalt-zinc-cadmium resistance protein CzcA [Labilithrix luteola]|uniref:Cobalt-zinc-cadmium resistance protein CzcA n=1 Tax=Labilithrix luteola TaxID=1391654 RepID=A0A0K1PJ92_9BACT|nr:efflux RND transporter permease subunit [Labilithrix luteola]AKU93590.1 Cobalt-zinc-cadmium resistance protein CzcA [Labilithrix luteola]
MTALALRNPIAMLMLCIALAVFAAVVTPRMPIDTFPELTPPVLVVGTLAPGLGPKDMEKTITWRVEKYVSATPGVDHVESISRNNLSIVFVWMKWGTDLNGAQTLVQQQVQFAMAAVPKSLGVLPPFVLQFDPSNAPVVQVALWGENFTGPQLYDYAFNNIEPRLEGISGVASAALNGGRQRQINIIVDPAKVQARSLTAQDVAEAVSHSNALLPSGEFISPKFDANVYTNAIPKAVKEIGDAAVKVVDGMPVLIRDVARVEDGGSPPTQDVSVNGTNAVYLNVLRVPGGNTLAIVESVDKVVAEMEAKLPPGMHVRAIFDASTFVRTSYHGLKVEVIRALCLIAVVILIFLQSVRGTLIVAVAIPLSFAIALIVLYATGQTLNAFTLGGMTLAMGRLVDDAVVVLESIHRHQRQGMSVKEASLVGTNAVALPVLASMLTTIAVLLPVVLLAGLAKRLFVPLALTVATAMIASYFVSMMVTPVACRYFLGHAEVGRLGKKVEHAIDALATHYSELLRRVLPFRFTILAASVLLVVVSVFWATKLPSTFFPEIDESMERIYVRFAPGTSLEDSTRKLQEMGKVLQSELPKGTVDLVLTNAGSPENARSAMTSPNWGPHMGFVRLQLVDPEKRSYSQRQISDLSRAILNRQWPGVDFLQWPGGLVASVFSNGYFAPMVVELRGEDLTALDEQAKAVAAVARSVDGVRDVWITGQMNYPEIHVDTNREKAGLVGVTLRSAAQSTLEATLGNINTPSVWIDSHNGQSYYVVTQYDRKLVTDANVLAQVPVRVGEDAAAVTLGSYGKIRRAVGPIAVERNSLERATHIEMQTEGRDIGSAVADLTEKLRSDARTRDLPFRWVGQVQLMQTTFSGLGLAIGLAVMVVFMIMAAQFKSLRLPFVMLFTIPVSLVGIDLALMAAGQGFSITALMGVLMVVGIAVSNGILLVAEANHRFQAGAEKREAVVGAAKSRFVPIMMTSLATVIGLVPTAFALERGTESNQPLALAVVGGLVSSTVLSLFLVPVMFLFVAKREVEAEG